MKRALALLLALSFSICHGQDPEELDETPSWLDSTPPTIPTFALESTPSSLENGCVGGYSGSSSAIAETITPEIQALARGLGNDPVRIYNYVHDHIKHVLYFGSRKGAHLTLLERSGNDFDQSALLVALLRAAGYTAHSQFGFITMPWESPDHRDIPHWLQLNVQADRMTVSNYLYQLTGVRGYPMFINSRSNTNIYTIHRVWVALAIGGTNYYLDPGFKVHEPISGLDIAAAVGLDTNALMTAAGGTVGSGSIQGLDEAAVRNKLRDYTTNLLGYLESNYPNASVEDVLSGWRIVPSTNTWFSLVQPFTVYTYGGRDCVMDWDYQPTNFMTRLSITFAGTNFSLLTPSLSGQRLVIAFSNGVARFWQDEALLAQLTTTGSRVKTNIAYNIHQPFGYWDLDNNIFHDMGWYSDSTTNAYMRTNGTYALFCGFDVGPERVRDRQNRLDAYLQRGNSATNWLKAETLNVMGLSWMEQTDRISKLLAAQGDTLHAFHHRFGRVALEPGNGYYIDFPVDRRSHAPTRGWAATDWQRTGRVADVGGYFMSGVEHGMIEQLQTSNLVAASSMKMLQIANTNNVVVYLAKSGNWANIRDNLLINYSAADKTSFNKLINAGYHLLIPRNGLLYVSAGGVGWRGWGLVARLGGPNYLTAGFKYLISGNYSGGYISDSNADIDPSYVVSVSYDQPTYFDPNGAFVGVSYSYDPVRLSDGAFEVEATDLSLGQAEPRGITFTRTYNSMRRYQNPAGMACGWLHNYSFKIAEVSSPEAALGLSASTPAQTASMLVATRAAFDLYQTNGDPKNWLLTALITKWGIDRLVNNAVAATMGENTVQFITQPDGSFTPPANCTMTLVKSNSAYNLSQRHGNIFKFDSTGRLTNIVDQYGQGLNLSYNASNWVTTVTDWKGRSLTLAYSGTPLRLTSVSDSTGRSVSYGYATNYNSAGDLISFTDSESKTGTFIYDTNHQIIATKDALNRVVVSNAYDAFGRVIEQYNQGDTNKTWRFYWSGFANTEQDPTGARRYFFYDDKSRQIAEQDALGNVSQTVYDGQDHVVMTVSPFGEITQFQFDGRHNMVRSVDPLGLTNQFFYDSQHNLFRVIDARGNTNSFGYNAKFQLTGATNGAGAWTTLAYNGTDGTLASRTDLGGTTTHSYDTWGQLNGLTYPGGLGNDGFLKNALGDTLSHTNGRGFVTSFQYNARREITNTVAPTNLAAKVVYDASANVLATIDARGFAITNLWSATRKQLATIFPATPQGTPVATNIYDVRDWLAGSRNPLGNSTWFTNDAAGRLANNTDPLSRITRFGYDANGRRVAVTNAALEVLRQQWTARGELASSTDGATHTVVRGYDNAGNHTVLTNRNGKRWQFRFDAANRRTNTITPLNREIWLAHDARGLVKNTREPSGQFTTNLYDARGRMTNYSDSIGAIAYSYDANNNRTIAIEAGKSNVWAFDAYDRVSSYRDADGNLIQYRYDANGNLTNLVYPGSKNVFYAYDSLNRLTNVMDWANRKTSFEYDLASRLKKITRPNGTFRTMDYDAAGQATNIWEKTSTGVPLVYFKLNWNTAARIEWEFAAPPPHAYSAPTRSMTFDDDNRLATFNSQSITHDLDGNMTSGPLTNNTLTNYTYDARNRLLSAGGLTYRYDVLGNRVTLTNGTNIARYVVDPNAALSQVLMRVGNGATNYYVYGAGLLYEADDAGSTRTYHYDYRGSTVALTDGSGNVTDRAEYSAYGMLTYRTGATDTPFWFNGQSGVQTDVNGLLQMRARYYNPYVARFVTADPIGFDGGMNWYAFADGNPVMNADPSGLESFLFPPQYAQSAEFREGFNRGMGMAAPAGLGIAGAVFLGPILGGAALSAGVNTTSQMLNQFINPGTPFSYTQLGVQTAVGAGFGAIGSAAGAYISSGFRTAPMTIVASASGEALSGTGPGFHVVYSVGGQYYRHAVGSFFSMQTSPLSTIRFLSAAGNAYGGPLTLPIANTVGASALEMPAISCLTGAISAFGRGWLNVPGAGIGQSIAAGFATGDLWANPADIVGPGGSGGWGMNYATPMK